jgi:glutathione S-transferase
MTDTAYPPIKLFQFPRMFGIPNLSPFCCKLETWLRIARVPYEVVDTPDPRNGPKGKLPFIEDGGVRIADSSLIIDHFVKSRGVDPDARLDASQRATALLVQRTLEEHYAFVPGLHAPRQGPGPAAHARQVRRGASGCPAAGRKKCAQAR